MVPLALAWTGPSRVRTVQLRGGLSSVISSADSRRGPSRRGDQRLRAHGGRAVVLRAYRRDPPAIRIPGEVGRVGEDHPWDVEQSRRSPRWWPSLLLPSGLSVTPISPPCPPGRAGGHSNDRRKPADVTRTRARLKAIRLAGVRCSCQAERSRRRPPMPVTPAVLRAIRPSNACGSRRSEGRPPGRNSSGKVAGCGTRPLRPPHRGPPAGTHPSSPNSDRPRHRDDTTRHAPTHTALPNGYAVTISGAGHDTQTDQRPGQRL
jgi:hypothetical protein